VTFLVDTNVLGEGLKPRPDQAVLDWLHIYEEEIVIDSVILGEVLNGVLKLPHGRKRREMEAWFELGVRKIICLPWDAPTAIRWAHLLSELRQTGREMAVKDSMIAASALAHRLTLVTRNERHFQYAGLQILNPFE
jgi:predicted nucleic acid-binding protein